MNWRKSVLLKKAVRYGFDLIRPPYKRLVSYKNYEASPPVLTNSFPKSGTHLLIQVLQAIPGIKDCGQFLASTPSFTFKEIPGNRLAKKIEHIVPNELISAHLFFSEIVANALSKKNVVHFFIYRDPRDVVISEAHYLTHMNRWHKLHKYFKALPDMKSRILFSIQGAIEPDFPYDYPDIAKRFQRYRPWINHPDVLAIRFEDLAGFSTENTVKKIVRFYCNRTGRVVNQENLVQKALANIDPKKSHTFRKGKTSAWKESFTDCHKSAFKKVAADLLLELGYERDHSW